MKEFWKDYGKLWKDSFGFCKKHWKGVALLNAAIIGTELAYYQVRYHLFDINLDFGKKSKKKEEEEAQ